MLKHLLLPDWWRRRVFSAADLAAVGQAIAASEQGHRGELRFVVEAGLPPAALWRDVIAAPARRRTVRRRAGMGYRREQRHPDLRELADRRVEILADRGIAARVPQAEWDAICRAMEQALAPDSWRQGALAAVARAG
jgi:hypothetical protein